MNNIKKINKYQKDKNINYEKNQKKWVENWLSIQDIDKKYFWKILKKSTIKNNNQISLWRA